jgi:hypothetical protein
MMVSPLYIEVWEASLPLLVDNAPVAVTGENKGQEIVLGLGAG